MSTRWSRGWKVRAGTMTHASAFRVCQGHGKGLECSDSAHNYMSGNLPITWMYSKGLEYKQGKKLPTPLLQNLEYQGRRGRGSSMGWTDISTKDTKGRLKKNELQLCKSESESESESVSHWVLSDSIVTPVDCSLPGCSVHGLLQAKILEWIAMPSSRGSFRPRDWSWVFCIAARFFTVWATRESIMERQP